MFSLQSMFSAFYALSFSCLIRDLTVERWQEMKGERLRLICSKGPEPDLYWWRCSPWSAPKSLSHQGTTRPYFYFVTAVSYLLVTASQIQNHLVTCQFCWYTTMTDSMQICRTCSIPFTAFLLLGIKLLLFLPQRKCGNRLQYSSARTEFR